MAVCETAGVRFVYPDEWSLTEDDHGRDVTLHLQTEGTAFWSLSLLASRPTADEAVEAVVAAFREVYPDLDIYKGPELMVDGPAAGCELDFVCLDLVNSAVVRAEMTSEFTAVVVYQAENREFDTLRPEFEQVTGSLKYANDEEAAAEDL